MQPFKPLRLQELGLSKHRIDIWQFPLDIDFNGARSILTLEEQQRADRFYFAKHQQHFTIARAMLRIILAAYLNTPRQQLAFAYNPQGKPYLESKTHIEFNLSHSGSLALLAIGQNYPVGIDLENFSARPYLGIGQQIFSAKENQQLQQIKTYLKPIGFFHLWAQKEALIKACGLGLSYPTKQFDLSLLPPADNFLVDPKYQRPWRIRSFTPKIACCAAICHHPDITDIRYLSLQPTECESLYENI